MALNYAMLDDKRNPVPLPHEMTIIAVTSGVDLVLRIPDAPPVGSASAGGSGGTQKHEVTGKIWLTDQRLLFVSAAQSTIDSLTIPLHNILSTHFEQPTFGTNYLAFGVKPSAPGSEAGITEGTNVELRFKNEPMFQFASLLDKTRERAIYMKRQTQEEEDTLPTYTSPVEGGGSSGSSFSSVPMDLPPGYSDGV